MILHGDCLERLRAMDDNSIDAVVTDPPYGLAFMGKRWDYDVPSVDVWREVLRVLKPGGHALVACGTRTQHRMVVNIEDAGFEIRDVVTWLYGQGFPKSLDISKAIDKAAGAERAVTREGVVRREGYGDDWDKGDSSTRPRFDKPVSDAAKQWQGWGTALKPACEFWTLARKPLEGTVAANVLRHGTGGLNIDGCRIETEEKLSGSGKNPLSHGGQNHRPYHDDPTKGGYTPNQQGRFPANLILDEEAAAALDEQSGTSKSDAGLRKGNAAETNFGQVKVSDRTTGYSDSGGASRFFYVAKVSSSERNAGLEDVPKKRRSDARPNSPDMTGKFPDHDARERTGNFHPTVKPVKLMRYLCRLVTPPGGLVLDPFAGSGSTGVAAVMEGFRFVGIEMEDSYVTIARARLAAAIGPLGLQRKERLPSTLPESDTCDKGLRG